MNEKMFWKIILLKAGWPLFMLVWFELILIAVILILLFSLGAGIWDIIRLESIKKKNRSG